MFPLSLIPISLMTLNFVLRKSTKSEVKQSSVVLLSLLSETAALYVA